MDHAATARAILAGNRYMTLATADADGTPWASPVWFASEDPHELLWISILDTRHSRNIAVRPEIALVIFDSTAAIGTGQAVYVEATAGEAPAERIEAYSRCSLADGGREWTTADIAPDAPYRLYRASARRHWILDSARPDAGDHRVEVQL